jgi:type IV pilus assembly protein PilA
MFQSVLRRLRDTQTAELEDGEAAEAGFTLIELMVVLLIIAILLAIAIPTFLGVTGSANDRSAQSNLTNALTEASAVYQGNNQAYSGISAALVTQAPEFTWSGGGTAGVSLTAGSNQISVAPVDVAASGDTQGVELADLSKANNTCWYAVQLNATPLATGITGTGFDVAASGTGFQTGAAAAGTYYAKKTGATTAQCTAAYPQSKTGGFTWGTSYSNAPSD